MPERSDFLDDNEMAELRALMERGDPKGVVWEQPPPGMWDRIAEAIEREPSQDEPAQDEPVHDRPTGGGAEVIPMAGRRRNWWYPLAAAAAALVAVPVGLAVWSGGDDDDRLLSAVELDRLAGSGSGRAELIEHDGALQVRLETSDLDPADGYLELWLIDETVTKLVSLGPVRPDGVYDVPAGVDPAAFPIVDVSVEPVDGDPTHSGESVLRGELTF